MNAPIERANYPAFPAKEVRAANHNCRNGSKVFLPCHQRVGGVHTAGQDESCDCRNKAGEEIDCNLCPVHADAGHAGSFPVSPHREYGTANGQVAQEKPPQEHNHHRNDA